MAGPPSLCCPSEDLVLYNPLGPSEHHRPSTWGRPGVGCASRMDYLPRDVGWVLTLPSGSVSLHWRKTSSVGRRRNWDSCPPLLEQAGERPSWGLCLSVWAGKSHTSCNYLQTQIPRVTLALRGQQNWEQWFSNFGTQAGVKPGSPS